MDSVTFFWTLLATLFAGVHIFLGKIVAHKKLNAAWNNIITYSIASPTFFLCYLLSGQHIPVYWIEVMVLALCAGAAYGMSAYTRIEALKHIDTVIFFPLSKILGPFLTVLCGVFLFSEDLSRANVIGIALSMCVPLLLIQKSEHARQKNLRQGIMLMVVSTVTATLTILCAKGAFSISEGIFWYMSIAQFAGLGASIVLLKREEVRTQTKYVHASEDYLYGVVSSIVGMASYFCLMMAVSSGKVSLVYTIQAHYIVIPIILSVWFYNEHMDVRKFAAVALSLVAIGLLV